MPCHRSARGLTLEPLPTYNHSPGKPPLIHFFAPKTNTFVVFSLSSDKYPEMDLLDDMLWFCNFFSILHTVLYNFLLSSMLHQFTHFPLKKLSYELLLEKNASLNSVS